jgi:REP element-mobilizing transposase RayT
MIAADRARFFHCTMHPAHPRACFRRTADYRVFLTVLRDGLARYPVRLLAYTILPDRWHLIAGPTDPVPLFDLLARVVKTHLTQAPVDVSPGAANRRYEAPLDVEPLTAPLDIVRRCGDVERQALAAGLVMRAQDWPWSSLADRVLSLQRVPLAPTPFLASQTWLDYLNDAAMTTRGQSRAPQLGDLAEMPRRLARLAQRGQQTIRVRRRSHEDQTDAHVERAEHLRLRHAAGSL